MKTESSRSRRKFVRAGIAFGIGLWASGPAAPLLRAAGSDQWGDLVGHMFGG